MSARPCASPAPAPEPSPHATRHASRGTRARGELLDVQGVWCGYGNGSVLADFGAAVDPGELVCLLGPSGCGKTTALRAIAGLSPIQAGVIRLRGRTVSAPGRLEPPEDRALGMVFQDFALFPHLDVLENVAFGLRRLARAERNSIARSLIESMGLAGFEKRYPHELSGGQQQRVALARALAPGPDLVLLDEPFSSLDVELRARLGPEVADALRERGTAAVLVTHDQNEAFTLAERIGVMFEGRVRQWASPVELYREPADRLVAEFVGHGSFIRARLGADGMAATSLGPVRVRLPRGALGPGSELEVLVRPDEVELCREGGTPAWVVRQWFRGAVRMYLLRTKAGEELLASVPARVELEPGAQARVCLVPGRFTAFPPMESGLREAVVRRAVGEEPIMPPDAGQAGVG